jgi:hypothetical protein
MANEAMIELEANTPNTPKEDLQGDIWAIINRLHNCGDLDDPITLSRVHAGAVALLAHVEAYQAA